jgi:hypothetical protein
VHRRVDQGLLLAPDQAVELAEGAHRSDHVHAIFDDAIDRALQLLDRDGVSRVDPIAIRRGEGRHHRAHPADALAVDHGSSS